MCFKEGGQLTGENNHCTVDCSRLETNGGILIGRMLILRGKCVGRLRCREQQFSTATRVKSQLTSTNEWPAM